MKYPQSEILNIEYRLLIHIITYMNENEIGPTLAGKDLGIPRDQIGKLFKRNGIKRIRGKYVKTSQQTNKNETFNFKPLKRIPQGTLTE